jgi:hypothetical protein
VNDEGVAMNDASGLTAGILLIVVLVACTVAGAFAGSALGSTVLGGFAGGIIGVALAFYAVYRVYMVPLRKQSLDRDYSHLQPQLDDDD